MHEKEEIIDGVRKKYIDQILAENPELFKGAEDIHWSDHLKMQGILQKHVDSSISKTINCPNETTVAEVKEMYEEAWKLGLKGVTIYRNGSRAEQVLSTEAGAEAADTRSGVHPTNKPDISIRGSVDRMEQAGSGEGTWPPELFKLDLPDDAPARRFRVRVDGTTVYINVTEGPDGEPLEVFTKFPYASDPTWNVVCRQLSLSLRYGIPLVDIIKQLDKSVVGVGDMSAKISRVLKKYLTEGQDVMWSEPVESDVDEVQNAAIRKQREDTTCKAMETLGGSRCPNCSQVLTPESGCWSCKSCGWEKCS